MVNLHTSNNIQFVDHEVKGGNKESYIDSMIIESFECGNNKGKSDEKPNCAWKKANKTLRERQKNKDHDLQDNEEHNKSIKDTHSIFNLVVSFENLNKSTLLSQHNEILHWSSTTLASDEQQISNHESKRSLKFEETLEKRNLK